MTLIIVLGLLALYPSALLLLSGQPGWALLGLVTIPVWFFHPILALISWFSFCALARSKP